MPKTDLSEYKIEFSNFGKKAAISVGFGPGLFAADSAVFSHPLARLSAQLAAAGYDMPWRESPPENSGIYKCLAALGFDKIVCYSETGRTQVDCTFACADMNDGAEAFRLVFCCLVGSHYEQWYENFDSGTSPLHKGFEKSEAFAFEKLQQFIAAADSGDKKLKFLITGHSRGGATANLLAAHLIRENLYTANERVFAYTFAAPSCYSGADRRDEKYRRIFNIIHEEDFVTRCMPRVWGYGRYGRTLALPNSRNCPDYAAVLAKTQRRYGELTEGARYYPFKKGPATVDCMVKGVFGGVKTVEEYYGKTFRCGNRRLSVQQYFSRSLCAVTGEKAGSPENKAGLQLLLKTAVNRLCYDKVFRAVADFFVFYEGLGGITKGKLSKNYFSLAHEMTSYCALLLAAEENQLKEETE